MASGAEDQGRESNSVLASAIIVAYAQDLSHRLRLKPGTR
jgi:hypothetical protein